MCTSGGMLAAAGADALCRPSCVIHLLRASAPAVAAVAQGPQAICNMHACIVKSGIQSETPSQARAACHQACACKLTAADQQSRAYCTCTCAHAQTGRKAGRQAGRQTDADADAPNMVVRLPAGGTIILFRLRGQCRTARAINALHVMLCRGLLTNAAIKEHKNDHRRHPCTKSISPACCQQGEQLLPLPFRAPFIAPVCCQHTHDEVGGDD
jgi:hypothetical protein